MATSTLAPVTSFLPEDCTCRIARWMTRWKPCVGWVSASECGDSRGVCSLMKSVSTPRSSSRSTPQALSTSAADGLSSIASSRCSTVMNSCCFCRASTKAIWRETSSSCAIMVDPGFNRSGGATAARLLCYQPLSFLHRTLQRVLVPARDVQHLIDFRGGDLARVGSAHTHAFAVNLQHHLGRLFPAHRKHSLQHHDDKVHRCVVVIEQNNLVQRRGFEPDLLDLENITFL